mgnify:CR=1 FL=1
METITQKQASELLGVTTRRLRQIEQEQPDDPPPRDQDGQYPAPQFGEWLRAQWRKSVGFTDDGAVYDYDQERARLTHHQANAAALEEQTKQGRLIPADLVKQTWSDLIMAARARLLALPSKLAGCAGSDPAEVEAQARAIVYEALRELAASNNTTAPIEE